MSVKNNLMSSKSRWTRIDQNEMLIHNIRGLDHIDDIIEDKMREQLKKTLIEKAAQN